MSRIYVVRKREGNSLVRYVRAHTLNGAVRAVSDELFEAKAASTNEIYEASKNGVFDVLDALDEQPKADKPKLQAVK